MKKFCFLLGTLMIGVMFQSCEKAVIKADDNPEEPVNGIEFVDLGLPSGTKWATCNVGARTPTEFGDYCSYDKIESINSTLPTEEEWEELMYYCGKTFNSDGSITFYNKQDIRFDRITFPAFGGYWRDGDFCDVEEAKYLSYNTGSNQHYIVTMTKDSSVVGKEEPCKFWCCVRQVQHPEVAPIRGIAKRIGDIYVNWIQLWENGPKFAEYNVGASSATEYGGYYTWGSTYQNGNGIPFNSTHYHGSDSLSGYNDTATELWGQNWRMPTSDEFQALIDSCDLEWTTIESVRGCKFTGKGDYAANSVFFPAGGICLYDGADLGNEGYYWTNTPAIDSKDAAYSLNLKPKNEGLDATGYRGYAHSVRAVLAK